MEKFSVDGIGGNGYDNMESILLDYLKELCMAGHISTLDFHFARFMGELDGDGRDVLPAAVMASLNTRQGHICLDLNTVAGKPLLGNDNNCPYKCPGLKDWVRSLRKSRVAGFPHEFKPLVLDSKNRLYLYRYWEYENELIRWLRLCGEGFAEVLDQSHLKEGFNRFFPREGETEMDRRKMAAFVAMTKRISVISGGPGSGKTSLVSRILALIIEQSKHAAPRIRLTAPTGKAATRLRESIGRAKNAMPSSPLFLPCDEKIRERLPETAATIHRLLGGVPDSPYFRHNEQNPVAADVVVVDEASMIDLPLMSKLVQALEPKCRLILLGDKDQLASVEAGAVLGDLCHEKFMDRFSREFGDRYTDITGDRIPEKCLDNGSTGFRDCIVELEKSFRFHEKSGIGVVSRAVKSSDSTTLMEQFANENPFLDIEWKPLPSPERLYRELHKTILDGYADFIRARETNEIFEGFSRFRILCALRKGPYGVEALNRLAEKVLAKEKKISPNDGWYVKRPVMITENDYNLGLYNGDIGIALAVEEGDESVRVFFEGGERIRKIHPFRLKSHETVFSMTVHKSQGSEFDKVVLILPDKDVPVLTRELVYTGITRGIRRVEIRADKTVLKQAVEKRIERASGLKDAIWDETHG
jgi:exodeoxyribonuclease V alpha subunit